MDKVYKNSLIATGKLAVTLFLVYITLGLLHVENVYQLGLGIGLLFCVTLPTIFVFYFKRIFEINHPKFKKIWKFLRFLYAFFLIIFALMFAWGYYRLYEKNKTKEAVDFIASTKITLDDAMGKNLPPEPDKNINDSTISGIDANKNHIRDDVELAIFKRYPNSVAIRAAELQYAQALQLELTKVFNSDTLIAALKKEASASFCISKKIPDSESSTEDEQIDNLVFNTNSRTDKLLNALGKYMTSYSLPSIWKNNCDLDD